MASSSTLQQISELRRGWNYTPKTDAELRTQAEGEYQSYYDQLRLAAQQQQAASDLRLAQQREGLATTYDKQREQSAKQYAQAYSQADRQLLRRGMQRSSYGAQSLANISTQGAEAQQTIADAQAAAEANIDAQRTLLQQQLAAQMSQYTASQQSDVLNRLRQLQDQEYNRQVDAWKSQSTLLQQLYQNEYQQERDAIADAQWERTFEENQRQFDESLAKKSSGGGGGTKKSTTATANTNQFAVPNNLYGQQGYQYTDEDLKMAASIGSVNTASKSTSSTAGQYYDPWSRTYVSSAGNRGTGDGTKGSMSDYINQKTSKYNKNLNTNQTFKFGG